MNILKEYFLRIINIKILVEKNSLYYSDSSKFHAQFFEKPINMSIMKKVALIISLFLSFANMSAQGNSSDTEESKTKLDEKRYELTVMPFFNYNRNIKFMLGAIPMAMYNLNKQDTISPKSLSGAIGVYTTNKSYFIGFFNKLYYADDSWRGTFFLGTGNINSQFFIDDINSSDFYSYGTNATVFSAGIQRKVILGLYGGITYTYAKYKTEFSDDIMEETTTVTNGLEFNVLYDTRDDVYYPKSGNKFDIKWISYAEWLGNEMNADKIKTIFNKYIPMRKNTDVLAARASGTFGLGEIAFEQQTVVGGKDIRGYSEGKYRGKSVIALQAEYRLNFAKRMGVVAFAGAATLYGSDNENFDGTFLPGGGIGFRYKAFKKVKFNIGLDAAVGKDDWGLYFRIGEAF